MQEKTHRSARAMRKQKADLQRRKEKIHHGLPLQRLVFYLQSDNGK